MTDRSALIELLQFLSRHDYRFTAVTPATHEKVVARPLRRPPTLRDIFGWNRPFTERDVDPQVLALLRRAGAVEVAASGELRSRVRVATLADLQFLHSAFPTTDEDSVFFGPDTYRFWRFLEKELADRPRPKRLVDMGAGSGAGGILTSRLLGGIPTMLVDVNQNALSYAEINAAAAGIPVDIICADTLPTGADLVIANPPYLMDESSRTYRDGGELLGGSVSLDWARQAIERMRPGGLFLMYTGALFADGAAPLLGALEALCADTGASLRIEEIDPDVFGEELLCPAYAEVERIAAVGIRIQVPD